MQLATTLDRPQPLTQVGTVATVNIGAPATAEPTTALMARPIAGATGSLDDAISAAQQVARSTSADGFSSQALAVSQVADGQYVIQQLVVGPTPQDAAERYLSITKSAFYAGSGPRIERASDSLQAIVDMHTAHRFEPGADALVIDPWGAAPDLAPSH